jgi:hypothetical protein
MANAPGLYARMPPVPAEGSGAVFVQRIIPFLVDVWMSDSAPTLSGDVVQTSDVGGEYLFDVSYGRLIAAWAISEGRADHERDKARMQGHPLSAGPLYHRGHAIPHTLGGGTDINLVAQRGSINVGPFRPLEKEAVATPGALYFSYWRYPRLVAGGRPPTQRPSGVDQGLLTPGRPPEIARHGN